MLMDGGKTKRQSKQTPRKNFIALSSLKNVVCLAFRIITVIVVGSLVNQFMMFRSWLSTLGEKVFGKSVTSKEEQKSSDNDVGTCVDSGHSEAIRSLGISANCDNESCRAENGQNMDPVCLTNSDENIAAVAFNHGEPNLHNSNSSLEYATCTDSDQDEPVSTKLSVEEKNDLPSTSDHLLNSNSPAESDLVKKDNHDYLQEDENIRISVEEDGKPTCVMEVVSVDHSQIEGVFESQNLEDVRRENTLLVSPLTTDDQQADTCGVLDQAADREETRTNSQPDSAVEVSSTQTDKKNEPSYTLNVEQGIDVAKELLDDDGNVMSNWVSLEIKGTGQNPITTETENEGMEIVQVITSNQTVTRTTEKLTNTKTSLSLENNQVSDEMMDVSMPTDCSNISVTDVKEAALHETLSTSQCIETDIITATVGGSPTAIINISYCGDTSMDDSVVQDLFGAQPFETNDHCYSKVEVLGQDDIVHINAGTNQSCEETDTYPCPDNVANVEEGTGFGDIQVINNGEIRKFDLDGQNPEIKESMEDKVHSCSTLCMEESGKNVLCASHQDEKNQKNSSVEVTEDLITCSTTPGLDTCEDKLDTCSSMIGAVQSNDVDEVIDKETVQDYVTSCINEAVVFVENSETNQLNEVKSDDETNKNVDTKRTECESKISDGINSSQNASGNLQEDPKNFLQFCQDKTSRNHIMDPKRLIYGLGHLKDTSSEDLKSAVLGQYKIAVKRKLIAWVKDLRYYAEILFSVDWVDENLPSLQSTRKKTMKRSERRKKRQGKEDGSLTEHGDGMCRDIRLKTDPSIEVIRENALEDSSVNKQQLAVDSADGLSNNCAENAKVLSGTNSAFQRENQDSTKVQQIVTGNSKSSKLNSEMGSGEMPVVVDSGKESLVEESGKETCPLEKEKVATFEDFDKEQLFAQKDSNTNITEELLHCHLEVSGTEQVDSAKNKEKTSVVTASNLSQSDENLKRRLTCNTECTSKPKEHLTVKGNKKDRKKKKAADDKADELKGNKNETISKKCKEVHQGQSSEVKNKDAKTVVSSNKDEASGEACSEYTEDEFIDDLVNSFIKSIVESVSFDSKNSLNEDMNVMSENHTRSQEGQSGSIDHFYASGVSGSSNLSNSVPVVTDLLHEDDFSITNNVPKLTKENDLESTERPEDSFIDSDIIYRVKSSTEDSSAVKSPTTKLPEDNDVVRGNSLMQSDQGISMDLASATSDLKQILKISPDHEHSLDYQNIMNIQPSVECCQDPYISGIVNIKTDGEVVANLLGDTDFDECGQVEYSDGVTELEGRGPMEYDPDSMKNLCASHISELTDGQNVEESISQLVMERNHLSDVHLDGHFGHGEAHAYLEPIGAINVGEIEVTQQNQVSSLTENLLHDTGEVVVQAVENQMVATRDLRGEETSYSDTNGMNIQTDTQLSKNVDLTVEKASLEMNQIPVVISSRVETRDADDRTERNGLIEIKTDIVEMKAGVTDSANTEHDADNNLTKTFQAEFLQYCELAPASSEEHSAIASVETDYQQIFEQFVQAEEPSGEKCAK